MGFAHILRHAALAGAIFAAGMGQGLVTQAVDFGFLAVGRNHGKGTGDRRNEYEWMRSNDAQLEITDLYWQAAWDKVAGRAKEPAKPVLLRSGSRANKLIALTFDDGPHPKATDQLLDILARFDVPATFFVVGKQVRKHPEILRRIAQAGHEVGNHSFSHAAMSRLTAQEAMTEYAACSMIIRDVTGTFPVHCRPPGGRETPETLRCAARMNLKTAFWTCDPLDYAFPDLDVLEQRMERGLRPGAIFLLHSGARATMDVLPTFIVEARRRGYRFVTLVDLESAPTPALAASRPMRNAKLQRQRKA